MPVDFPFRVQNLDLILYPFISSARASKAGSAMNSQNCMKFSRVSTLQRSRTSMLSKKIRRRSFQSSAVIFFLSVRFC
ncbi:MAG: hypothetical protein A2028_03045 [Candidatus Aminicenantes bacterium RBG_19FT_COMBO_59_29]|nr:MAG: hypothetical protein A2028_03045 [Candidatus Aminicenantes bacterium RBG_19FT_COMBO_59_29]